MQVTIRDTNQSLGNNGIVLDVYANDGTFLGKLKVNKARLEWHRGKTRIGNGTKMSWDAFIAMMEGVD